MTYFFCRPFISLQDFRHTVTETMEYFDGASKGRYLAVRQGQLQLHDDDRKEHSRQQKKNKWHRTMWRKHHETTIKQTAEKWSSSFLFFFDVKRQRHWRKHTERRGKRTNSASTTIRDEKKQWNGTAKRSHTNNKRRSGVHRGKRTTRTHPEKFTHPKFKKR